MKHLLAVLLLLLPAAWAYAQVGGNAPVKKFRLPAYNDEGYRTTLLQGDEALMVSQSQIDVKEMQFSMFAGDENNTLDSTLLAPVATLRIQEKNKYLVEGAGPVRLLRADVDASGEDWIYRHPEKRLSIRKNVHVIFRSELKDILK
jgi:hypothetical protein